MRAVLSVVALLVAWLAVAGAPVPGTTDVIFGPGDPSGAAWSEWFSSLRRLRSDRLAAGGVGQAIYQDRASAWSDFAFRQYFLFMYDRSFYDGGYRTRDLIADLRARFGRVDSVLLWQGYPQIGFDTRDQFDFYRLMPGGLAGLKYEVVDVFHEAGIRVFLDFNPWDENGASPQALYNDMADLVARLDADGVMLDTLAAAPPELVAAVARRKRGVVFAPENRPSDRELAVSRQSWAQWYDLGGTDRASILRQKWLLPRHQQLLIRRWDASRAGDIIYGFFNGSGMLLWENIFGTWNPYSGADSRLAAETGAVIDSYGDLFTRGAWFPLMPTGQAGLDMNLWRDANGRALYTFRNRTDRALAVRLPRLRDISREYAVFWAEPGTPRHFGPTEPATVVVAPAGTQAVVVDEPPRAAAALEHFDAVSAAAAAVAAEGYSERMPEPRLAPAPRAPARGPHAGMAVLPAGSFLMTIEHAKRECGCYPLGAARDALFGYPFDQVITHRIPVQVRRFAMRRASVTNGEYLKFVHASGYLPRDAMNFLRQIPREGDGALPREISSDLAALPVTFVSLEDARAYARWKGERLPTEAEWQWAAEGAGLSRRWPWGNTDVMASDPSVVNLTGKLQPAVAYPFGASAQGVLNLSGNAWEFTESEWSDGHTRFVMLRGGNYLPSGKSEWLVPRGPRPNQFHAKYLIMSDGISRSESITFRTVVDL